MESNADLLSPSHDERTTAMLAHLLMIFTWFIGPLILYLVKGESRFVAFHSLQALIYQAICAIFSTVCAIGWFAAWIVWAAGHGARGHASGFPVGILIYFGLFWILSMGIWALTLTLGIIYTIKATNGEWAEYSIIGRWARRIVLGASKPA